MIVYSKIDARWCQVQCGQTRKACVRVAEPVPKRLVPHHDPPDRDVGHHADTVSTMTASCISRARRTVAPIYICRYQDNVLRLLVLSRMEEFAHRSPTCVRPNTTTIIRKTRSDEGRSVAQQSNGAPKTESGHSRVIAGMYRSCCRLSM